MEDSEAELVVSEAELVVSEADALGAEFITVELDTQPVEYVVKWAEAGSKFTLSCLKKEEEAELTEQLRVDAEDAFFAPYEEVFCEVTEQSVEVKTDSDGEYEDVQEVLLEADGTPPGDADSEPGDFEPEERPYHCSYCGKSYSHASSLYRHQQTHAAKLGTPPPPKRALEPNQEDGYTCPHCGLVFKGSRMLGSHLRLHGKRRIHPCNICGKEFNHSSSLSRHRLVHKKNGHASPKPAAAAARKQHQHHHRRLTPPQRADGFYGCPQCDMSFRTSTLLNKHQVTHVKELLGGYTAGKENLGHASSDLKIRLKLCSRDKPNFYTLCKKSRRGRGRGRDPAFEYDGDYEEGGASGGAGHLSCSLCGKRFSHASSLARHQQTHSADGGGRSQQKQLRPKTKTFTCVACNKTFMHSSSFSRHKKAHLRQEAARLGGATHLGVATHLGEAELDETAPLESDSE